MDALLVVALCFVAGVALRFVRSFPSAAAVPVLNAYAIHVALPALIVRQLATFRVSGDVLLPAVMPWVLLAAMVAVIVGLGRVRKWPRPVVGALLMVVPLGNTVFIGLPLIEALRGPEALPFAIVYDQLGSFLALTVYGAFITAAWSPRATTPDAAPDGRPARPSVGAIARKVVVFPPFIALLVGLAASALPDGLPPLLSHALERIAASLVPTVLVAVGLGWRFRLPSGQAEPFAIALVLKLALMPLVAWAIVQLTAASGAAADASILQAGMGPMITAGALAIAADLAPDLVAAIVGWGTLLSLGSVALVRLVLVP